MTKGLELIFVLEFEVSDPPSAFDRFGSSSLQHIRLSDPFFGRDYEDKD